MTRDDDRPRLASRLPDDPAYWDGLAERIAVRSAPEIEAFGARRAPWWGRLADFSPVLAAAAVVALLVAWRVERPAPPPSAAGGTDIGQLLVPDEPLARAFLADPEPPPIAALSWTVLRQGGNR
jgi:hypothetical protein